jgi:hypothetical protein
MVFVLRASSNDPDPMFNKMVAQIMLLLEAGRCAIGRALERKRWWGE